MLMTFLELDRDMSELQRSNNFLGEDGSQKLEKSGSTACLVLVTPKLIMCVNSGDSRAMYRTAGYNVQLSFDHKPQSDEERMRIEAAERIRQYEACRWGFGCEPRAGRFSL
jgi:serine/threonine protein phosphatase PrpC